MPQDIQKAQDLIGNAKTEQAIEILLAMNTEHNATILTLKNRLKTLKGKELAGIISNSDANTERNSINYSLLSLLPLLKQTTFSDDQIVSKPPINAADTEGLEKVIGRNGLQSISWLTKGAKKAKSVCKVHMPDRYVGTGFLIEGGYLLTNNHNIPSASIAQFTRIEFGFDGDNTPSVFYNLDHKDFITSKDLDYSRIKIKDNAQKPLSEWGVLTINSIPPQLDDALIIIQHPSGEAQQIAFSEGCKVFKDKLQYTVSTKPGSSGSPVFDINWNVVAIHHAGGNIPDSSGKTTYTNQGILIDYVLKDIEQRGAGNEKSDEEKSDEQTVKIEKPIKTLLVYHKRDTEYAEEITNHLFSHIRRKNIELFDIQTDIELGENKKEVLQNTFDESLLVLILISKNLYRKETMEIAMSVEEAINTKKVIPIRVSSFNLNGTAFEKLMGLPISGVPIDQYDNLDNAMYETVESIGKVIDKILGQ